MPLVLPTSIHIQEDQVTKTAYDCIVSDCILSESLVLLGESVISFEGGGHGGGKDRGGVGGEGEGPSADTRQTIYPDCHSARRGVVVNLTPVL